jgi:hypothetical protein
MRTIKLERKYNTKQNATSFKVGHKKIGGITKGDKMSNLAKEKIKQSLLGKAGKDARNWKGGISPQIRRKNAERPIPDKCDVCSSLTKGFEKGLHYDHNHLTGKFRGWLCMRCNLALGLIKDNVETLEKLIVYLKNNE